MLEPKTIDFEYKGSEYHLGFNRRTVKLMESQGVSLEKVSDAPLSQVENLFYGSFQMKHKRIKPDLVREIWDAIGNKEELIKALGELYAEVVEDFMFTDDEEDGDETKKIQWSLAN